MSLSVFSVPTIQGYESSFVWLNPINQIPQNSSLSTAIDTSIPGNRLYEKYEGTIELMEKTPAEIVGSHVLRPIVDKTSIIIESSFEYIRKSFHQVDTLLSRIIRVFPVAKAETQGLIGYFEEDCPEGWVEYRQADGRFILSSGEYFSASKDGRNETAEYHVGDTGGEINHNLTLQEIPRHNHINDNFKYLLKAPSRFGGICRGTVDQYSSGSCSGPYLADKAELLPVGNNSVHNNMPPYIALKACKKLTPEECHCDLDPFATKKTVDSNISMVSKNLNKTTEETVLLREQLSFLEDRISGLNLESMAKQNSTALEIELLTDRVSELENRLKTLKTEIITEQEISSERFNETTENLSLLDEQILGLEEEIQNLKTDSTATTGVTLGALGFTLACINSLYLCCHNRMTLLKSLYNRYSGRSELTDTQNQAIQLSVSD